MFNSTSCYAIDSFRTAALGIVLAVTVAGTAQAALSVRPQVAAAAADTGSPTQAQTQYRVPSLRQRPPSAVQTMPDVLKAARRNRNQQPQPGQTLVAPYGLAVGQGGTIYVANISAGVTIYSPSRKYLGAFTTGTNFPAAVAVSFNGDIYVANNGGNNVTIYNPAGQQVGTITDPSLMNPLNIYIDQDDTVWVLDSFGTLHSYLNDGTVLPTVHTGGTALGPWGPNVTVWGIANGSGTYDEVYQNRAEAVHFGASFPSIFLGGSPYAGGEAEDAAGHQYVTDVNNRTVQIWNAAGTQEVGSISTPATPYGIAVDSVNKRVYVAMTTLNEIYCYSTVAPYKQLAIIH